MEKALMKNNLSKRTLITIIVSMLFLVFQIYIVIKGTLPFIIQIPVHLCFALTLIYLYNPIDKKNAKLKSLRFLDFFAHAAIVFVFIYYITQSRRLESRMAYLSPITTLDIVASLVTIVILLEATRRTLGITFLSFILFCIAFLWFGNYIPRATGLRHAGTNLKQFAEMMTISSSGILGTPLITSASYLFYFMVFGALFATCGGGQLLIDIGLKFGKGTGGPAKAAVVSSALMGMISGAAVANVSTTGSMTIPMMKKTGYKPEQAGAIEAVASTGGQIMPPVMGIAAFVMAEMLGVDYKYIAGGATIPAIAYYLSIFLVVHFIAKQTKQGVMSKGFDIQPIAKRLFLLIPAIVLIVMIISGLSLMRSAVFASLAIVLINIVNPNRVSWTKVFEALIRGCKQAAGIAIPTAASGIVIACVVNSGLASKLASLMLRFGGDSLVFSLIIAMIGCILFGMALPTVAAYLLASILFCPALISLGISRLAANMFVFYFGIFAQITPPVCLASFTAASIAGANPWKTGWLALRWSLVAFLAAFAFVYNPALLLEGSIPEIIQASCYLFVGTYFLAAGLEHYVGVPVKSKLLRILLVLAGAAIIIPETLSSVLGFFVGMAIIVFLNFKDKMPTHIPDDAKQYLKNNRILLLALALAGSLIVIDTIQTTIAGLILALVIIVYQIIRKKPASLAEENESQFELVEGQVIEQDIDVESDDIILTR